LRLMVMQR